MSPTNPEMRQSQEATEFKAPEKPEADLEKVAAEKNAEQDKHRAEYAALKKQSAEADL